MFTIQLDHIQKRKKKQKNNLDFEEIQERTLLIFKRNKGLYPYGLSSAQKNAIIAYLEKQKGKPYEITKKIDDDSRWYCSKLVYKAYEAAGIKLIKKPRFYVLPNDLRSSPYLVEVPF